MKSIIIRQNGKVIIHIKKTKSGAEAKLANGLQELEIKVINDDNTIINL